MLLIITIEMPAVSSMLLLAFIYPRRSRWFSRDKRVLPSIARRRRMSLLLCGFLALALRAAVPPIAPVPEPFVEDEFSHLLAANTFAHGRVSPYTAPILDLHRADGAR